MFITAWSTAIFVSSIAPRELTPPLLIKMSTRPWNPTAVSMAAGMAGKLPRSSVRTFGSNVVVRYKKKQQHTCKYTYIPTYIQAHIHALIHTVYNLVYVMFGSWLTWSLAHVTFGLFYMFGLCHVWLMTFLHFFRKHILIIFLNRPMRTVVHSSVN